MLTQHTIELKNGLTSPVDGENIVKFIPLDYSHTIDDDAKTVTLQVSIPAPTAVFTPEVRRNVANNDIAVMISISTAARVIPIGDAPLFGTPGDWSKPNKYSIVAADGTTQEWTVEVEPLPEISQYEGFCQKSGTLVRIGNLADNLDAELYLQTLDANTVKAQAGKSVFNNTGITYFIRVNTDNSVTILSDPDAVVAIMPQDGVASTYDPATKTFDLHYHYRNEDRLFDTKLVLK